MRLLSQALTLAGLAATVYTQAEPVPGSYDGPLRPQVHFSPPKGFMNDPNGMFVDPTTGLHHLYYQLNPNQTIAGDQHWGHATSMDLYHWTNQPIAISPSNSTSFIFSGSAVVDVNNTSGFFPNQTNGVVAIYTLDGPVQQDQEIAYSTDGGYTFTKYANNPVLSVNSPNFRDPKVLWYAETQRWVMVVAYAQEYVLGIFTSTNLTTWTHASNFSHVGLLGLQYECPNLVAIPVFGSDGEAVDTGEQMYVMYISIQPGAPMGGSVGQYIPGTFNGTHFTAVDAAARLADFGKDNYATQFFSGYPGDQKQVSIGWASNWEYCNLVPTGPLEGWQSSMTLPRQNWLRHDPGGRLSGGWQLISAPYNISAVLPDNPVARNASIGNGTLFADFGNSGGSGSIMISVNATGLNSTELNSVSAVNVTLLSSMTGETLTLGIFLQGQTFWMDRGESGYTNVYFTDKASTALVFDQEGAAFDMQVFVDRSVWEVFMLGGQSSATMTFFPDGLLDTIVVKTGGVNAGAVVQVEVWELMSAWAEEEDSTGIVKGNVTTTATTKSTRKRRMSGSSVRRNVLGV